VYGAHITTGEQGEAADEKVANERVHSSGTTSDHWQASCEHQSSADDEAGSRRC
jgi:hypothetical protein